MKKETDTLSRNAHLDDRRWFLVDAQGQTVGRLASAVASLVRGKNNPAFSPHLDCGDFVVVINARQLVLSGNKLRDKIYHRHTEYPGGLRIASAEQVLAKRPEDILRKAITGMLPKTPLGRQLSGKVKIYPDATHPHISQQPVAYALGD
jgi:large subunit ribosomal protein L13